MKSKIVLGIVIVVSMAIAINYWQSRPADREMETAAITQATDGPQPLYWVAPMDANYRRDEPGLSPMGMPLIPVYVGGDTITVSSSIQQNLGVRTALVLMEDFSPTIAAVGYTRWDETSIQILHTRANGWLEVFNLASVGDRVSTGDPIYELFAPNLVSVQREYLTTLQSGNTSLASVSKDRLAALGFSQIQIDELDRSKIVSDRLVVRADRDAIVTHIGVRQGNYVEPQTALATLGSLDKVWIETEVFEAMASWIEPGLTARITFPAFPGETWSSELSYVYPELDPVTRSLRLRLIVENERHKLKPNMFANVQISAIPKLNVLTVPREAVIKAGQGDRVILSLGDGEFRPQIVQTGIASGSRIEIITGLTEGDSVVTSGQFLLDSEANGEQAFSRLTAVENGMAAPEPAMAMDMPIMSNQADDEIEVYSTSGEITQIVSGQTMTLAHEPVEELGWPAMVMEFQIPPELDISGFNSGDRVTFEFIVTAQGVYQLSNLRYRDAPQ